MIYVLFAIAAFMALVTAFITNSMSKTGKYGVINKAIVIIISLVTFMIIAFFVLQQKDL